jgi:hypothetical protein
MLQNLFKLRIIQISKIFRFYQIWIYNIYTDLVRDMFSENQALHLYFGTWGVSHFSGVYRYPGYNIYMNKPNTRKCIWCQELKNISDFDKYDKSSDGYRSQCKLCLNRSKKSGYIK